MTPDQIKIEKTFNKAMDQINNLQQVFRDEGLLAKAVVDIGGNQDFGAIQEAFDNLYGALEDGIYDAVAHIEVESVKQKLGMTEDKTIIPQGQRSVIVLAGDSIWDREGENPTDVYVRRITIENPYEPGGYMDDDEDDGYRSVRVEHNGPWSIYTDSGFSKAISEIVGFQVDFTEQGMQEDGMASMEGTMGDAMESVQEDRMGFSDLDKLGRENADRVDIEARRRGSADMEPGDADRLRYKIAKEMGLVESKLTEGYESIKRLQFLAGLNEFTFPQRSRRGTRPPDPIGPTPMPAPKPRIGEPIPEPRPMPEPKDPIMGPSAGDPVMPGISSADLDGDMPSEPSKPMPGIDPKDLDGDMPAIPDTPDMGKDFFGRDKAALAKADAMFKKYGLTPPRSALMQSADEETNEEKLTEGYESKVREICKDAGVDCSFKDGKLYVAKEDMAKAKKALEDNEDILELPDMVEESVAETKTDDDAGEEIKEQSPELIRLKQLIGIDPIREMKQ